MVDLSLLSKAVVEGEREVAIQLTNQALTAGVTPQVVITRGLQDGMGVVGEKFSSGEYFLPEMLMAARATKAVLEILTPLLEETDIPSTGRVLIGTVAGDIHDIGKNVVAAFLSGGGFKVFDLGVSVPDEKIIDEVRARKPDILGLSALLTTTVLNMGRIIKTLEETGLRSGVKVIVGGAAVTQDYANSIGADGYARDGGEVVPMCKRLLDK